MQPYIICQGDYLLKLAHQFGFDPDVVWNDDENAQLRQLRPNPNILFAGDILYIPDEAGAPPRALNVTTGSTNTFVTNPPTVTLTVCFSDAPFASKAYSVQELPELAGLTTDGNGVLTFTAPVTLETATVVFTDPAATFAFQVGNIDPIDTLSGIFQRLQNLGFIDIETAFDPTNRALLRAALYAFKTAQAPSSSAPPSAPSSSPPSSPSGSGESSPLSSGPLSSPASTPSPSSSSPVSDPGSSPPSSAGPPSSAPPSSGSSNPGPPDESGLTGDGTLDDATCKLLQDAHGS